VAHMKDLYDANPDRHRAGLATGLIQLSEQLGRLERHAECLHTAEEATALLREAVLDSGGAFVDEYARALSNVVAALENTNKPIGEVLGRVHELIRLFESARATEALTRGSAMLNAIFLWLDQYAQIAEQLSDYEGALKIITLVTRGANLLRGIDTTANDWLAAATSLRSRLLIRLGRTAESIAAVEDAVAHARGTARLTTLNDFARRLSASGDLVNAHQVAERALASLGTPIIAGITGDRGAWSVTVSLLSIFSSTTGDQPLPLYAVELLDTVLASAPSPPADEAAEGNLPPLAIRAFVAVIDDRPAQAMQILHHLLAAESRTGLPTAIRTDCAMQMQNLVCWLADTGRPDIAASVYPLLAAVADAAGEEIPPKIERAKAATAPIQAFPDMELTTMPRSTAADAEEPLRSTECLAVRERDLGRKPATFLGILDQIPGGDCGGSP